MKWRSIVSYLSKHWYERLISIFTAIVIMSCLSIFEDYWWPESFAIAYRTLICAALIDLILPFKPRIVRWILQWIAAIIITFRHARMEWAIAPPEQSNDWGWWIQQQTLAELHPFIWFAVVLLAIHIVFSAWTVTRTRMFGLIGTSILVLTIADSFTPIWLWDNVAAVVFTGLIWLMMHHLHKLQRTHPDSWRDLLEYPIRVVTPAVIVLSVFVIIGLNVPSVAPLLQDPYTIWKNARGEEVQVFLGEKAIVNDRSPNSSGNASSGYSRNDEVLGGGFDFDFSPMMTVTTSQKSYWRGETKALYDGKGWTAAENRISNEVVENFIENGESLPLVSQIVDKGEALIETVDRSLAEVTEVEQIVTMVREDPFPVLFGASPVSRVDWIGEEEGRFPARLLWMPNNWELRWNESEEYPAAYAVTSSVVALDEEELRKVEAALPNPEANALYLQLPNTVTDRTRTLAAEVTAEGTNDYDKAKLLENYLKMTYIYNNKPDLTKLTGGSPDFVDQFLFELQEGYCDYFSTAMAVMARSLDLPTRWVKGFSPGIMPQDNFGGPPGDIATQEEINPTGAGTYTVRNSDAHSWVEIYFEGYGWIPFEPTSGFRFPYVAPEGEEIALPELEPVLPETDSGAVETQSNGSTVWAWTALVVVLASAIAYLVLARRRVAAVWRRFRQGTYTTNDQIVMETHKLLRMCKKHGLRREEHETLREAVSRWTQVYKRLKDDFLYVLDSFEQAKYGARIATREETDRFVSKVRYLIGELK